MEWNPHYGTGVGEIDDHHKHLVELLNKAYEALTGNNRRERTAAIVGELVEYAPITSRPRNSSWEPSPNKRRNFT